MPSRWLIEKKGGGGECTNLSPLISTLHTYIAQKENCIKGWAEQYIWETGPAF